MINLRKKFKNKIIQSYSVPEFYHGERKKTKTTLLSPQTPQNP